MKARDLSVELFRVLLMLGICLIHSSLVAAPPGAGDLHFCSRLFFAIPAFVLITGWYGTHFTFGKVCSLYLRAAYAAACVGAVAVAFGEVGDVKSCVLMVTHVFRNYWFLNSYVLILAFAPALNHLADEMFSSDAVAARKALGACAGLAALLTCWIWLRGVPYVQLMVPEGAGISHYSFLMMVVAYLIGRILRQRGERFLGMLDTSPRAAVLGAIAVVGVCEYLCAFDYFRGYASPCTLAVAIFAFSFFRCVRVPACCGGLLKFVGPSIFSVYLLHTHASGFAWMSRYGEWLLSAGLGRHATYLAVAVTTFSICLVLDMPRRGVVRLVSLLKSHC